MAKTQLRISDDRAALHREDTHRSAPQRRWVRTFRTYLSQRATIAAMANLTRDQAVRLLTLPGLRHLRCIQFRRLQPLANGRQSGTAVVRYYWDHYLEQHRSDIRGRCLEIGTTRTVRRYGGAFVTQADAIDLTAHSPEITLVGDLSRADHLQSDTFDCFINQFTMHLIYDLESALYHSIRMLKPGGVLLVNFPCVDYYFPTGLNMNTGSPLYTFWWFTPIQVENLLRGLCVTEADYQLEIYGNLFARVAYQMNVQVSELTRLERDYVDPGHPLLICARIVKPDRWEVEKPAHRTPWLPNVTPANWNPVTGHYGD